MSTVSVVLPTYGGDDPSDLGEAIESVVKQRRAPDEVLIVRDGPVPDANAAVIEEYVDEYPFVAVEPLVENRGRSVARRLGVEGSDGEFVAMMDADDVCLPERLERQVDFLEANDEVDVVGTYLLEFDPDTGEEIGIRSLPTDHEALEALAKRRSPVSQSTVMARREAVLSAGNYRDVDRMEDYDLWARMLVDGARFANIPEILVKARTGPEMYERRGGWEYAREEVRQQWDFWRMGFVSGPRACLNLATRFPVRLLPNGVRRYVYEVAFRTD